MVVIIIIMIPQNNHGVIKVILEWRTEAVLWLKMYVRRERICGLLIDS